MDGNQLIFIHVHNQLMFYYYYYYTLIVCYSKMYWIYINDMCL